MENFSIFEIISGIINLIALIVFFVMAINIGNIRKTNKRIFSTLYKYAEKDGLITLIECSYCHKKYSDDLKRCPYCGKV